MSKLKVVTAALWLLVSMCVVAFAGTVAIEKSKKIVPQIGVNMLVNGDFEKDSNADGMPDEWGSVEHWLKTTRAKVARVKMPDGNHVLKVHFLTDGGCVINYLLRERSRYFEPGEPTDIYHGLRVKSEGNGVIYGHAITADYAPVGSTKRIAKQGDWLMSATTYKYDPARHRGIAMVRIYIRSAKAGDVYWIDDYVLKTVTPKQARALLDKIITQQKWEEISAEKAAGEKGVRKGNMLRDSSFESNPGYCPVRYGAKWWATGGKVVTGDAFDGECAIRDNATSDPLLFREGKVHTLSFYAKYAGGRQVRVTVTDSYSGRLGVTKTFKAKTKWKRFAFSFVPKQNDEAAQGALKVVIKGKGCLIDAVQLEEGALTDYSPVEGELTLLVKRHADRSFVSYFYDGEKIPMLATVCKKGPAVVSAEVVVRDFWMKAVRRIPVKFTIAAGGVFARQKLELAPLTRGAYRVHLEGGGKKSRSMQMGVMSRKLAEGAEVMGASHETGRNFNRHFIDALGVTWTRHHAAYAGPYWGRRVDVPWLSEKYWESCDLYTREKAWNPKLRHWGSFVYPPAPWRIEIGKISGDKTPLPEEFFKTCEEFFEVSVPRYKKTIKYWECWNEPVAFTPKQYLQMLKWFSKMIKRLDPEAIIVGFSGFLDSGSWDRYMVPLMKMGALEHCDVISYHGYFNDWPEEKLWGRMTLARHLDTIREYTAKAGKGDMPIWDNEFNLWGKSWYDDERVKDNASNKTHPFNYASGAAVIVHYVTIGYAHGVRHFGPHCFDHDINTQQHARFEYEQHAMDYDYGIKPKTVSFAVVCNKMNKANLTSEKITGDIHVYVFDKPAGSLAVVFMAKGKKARLAMNAAKELKFLNIFDGPFAGVSEKDGRINLNLIGQPVYIESKTDGKKLAAVLENLSIVE